MSGYTINLNKILQTSFNNEKTDFVIKLSLNSVSSWLFVMCEIINNGKEIINLQQEEVC
jgi:hypothetical protein